MNVYQFQNVIKILTSARSKDITILNWKHNPLKVNFVIFVLLIRKTEQERKIKPKSKYANPAK